MKEALQFVKQKILTEESKTDLKYIDEDENIHLGPITLSMEQIKNGWRSALC